MGGDINDIICFEVTQKHGKANSERRTTVRRMSRKILAFTTVLGLSCILVVAGCAPAAPPPTAEPQELKIGILISYTGPASVYGVLIDRSVELFLDEVGGSVKAGNQIYQYKFYRGDDKYMAPEGKAAAEKLIYGDKVKFLVGPAGKSVHLAIRDLVKQNNVLNLVATGSPDAISPDWPYVYNILWDVYPRLVNLMRWTIKTHPEIKFFMEEEPSDETGKAMDVVWKELLALPEFSGLKRETIWHERGTTDFYPIMTSALQKNPDMLYLGGSPGEALLALKAARGLGYKGLIMGVNPYSAEFLVGMGGSKPDLEGFIHSITVTEGPNAYPKAVQLTQKYQAKQWKPWLDAVATAYDGLFLLHNAIQKAGSIDVPKVAKAINETGKKGWEGAQGELMFAGAKRYGIPNQIEMSTQIVVIQDGKDVSVGEYSVKDTLKFLNE
jgi:branched-chain amino acid transport system substrate-binding protein